jgi:phage baseplate assembly protein gpV
VSLRMGPAIQPEEQPEFRRRAFRVGIVRQQDLANARVRVGFAEFDQMLSYWLPVVVSKAQNDKVYWVPDVGEQVVCLMDERDEAGVVLGAIYSDVDRAPANSADKCHLGFKDGTTIEYDRGAHVLALTFPDATTIKYDAGAHALVLDFSDGTAISYQVVTHALSIMGGAETSILIAAPAGIIFQAGGSQVTITASGVSVTPPLPLSSTVAQT